jgi:hypothetical protein
MNRAEGSPPGALLLGRREFIRLAGVVVAGAAGGVLAGCAGKPAAAHTGAASAPGARPDSSTTATRARATTTTTPPRAPGPADWTALRRALDGRLVTATSPGYASDAESYNPVFDGTHPEAIQYGANWVQGSSAAVVAANESWLDVTWQAMRPFVSGQAYQNYIDPKLANWAEAYYGANLGRLEAVKSTYDPEDVFSFPQSVQPER